MATVKVKCPVTEDNDQGFYIIEEADLTSKHELFEEGAGMDHRKQLKAMKKDELQKLLLDNNVNFDESANKDALIELCMTLPAKVE